MASRLREMFVQKPEIPRPIIELTLTYLFLNKHKLAYNEVELCIGRRLTA